MPTEYGQIYGQGVKYLKVNRYDSGGLDRSDYLGQLTNLTINYDDLGPIQYNIVTTQEQSDYFVYGIQTRNQSTSSVNYLIKNFNLNALKTSPFNINPGDNISINAFTTASINPNNIFDTSSGVYTFLATPNIIISGTIQAEIKRDSGTISIDSDGVQVLLVNNGGQQANIGSLSIDSLTTSFLPYTSSFVINPNSNAFSGDRSPIETYKIVVSGSSDVSSTGIVTIQNLRLIISQSTSPNSPSSSLTIFNPEFIDWDYNDYNALFGNAETPQFSSQLMDVDYTSTYTTPVNFDLIISGTADRAQVQDSNYTSQAWSNIRYNGVESNSPDFNQLTTNGGYGALPNVEQNKTYIAHFDAVGGTGPEIIGQTAYFIKYLIDEQGNVINPEPNTIALYNLLDSFESGKNALVRLISGDPTQNTNLNDDSLTGLHLITHVGRISPILMSETGSNFSDTASILYFDDFAQYSLISTPEYGFRAVTTTNTNIPFSNPEYTIICNLETLASSFYNNSTGIYTFTTNTFNYNNRVKFSAKGQMSAKFKQNAPVGSTFTVTFRIKKNNDIISYRDVTFTKISQNTLTYTEKFIFDTGFQTFNNTDQVKLTYDGFSTPGISDGIPSLLSGIEFKAQNEYPVNPITASAPYWTVGEYLTGNNVSVLTSSIDLINACSTTLYQSQSQDMLNFGFSKITEAFVPQAGDFIRIEYNPDKVFNITKVETTDRLYLTVTPPIPTGSILDHFVLYRIVNDGTYVILDVNKQQAGSSFTGIIQPEYISQTLKNNYSNIIQDLTQKGIIS